LGDRGGAVGMIGPRAKVLGSIAEAVGNTPMVRLSSLEAPGTEVWAKLELCNPGGSVKDRPALQMLLDAEAAGALKPGMSVIDSTSGNTGVALALFGAARGYRVTLVMPENVSSARKQMLSVLGAEIIYSSPMDGSDGAIRLVQELVEKQPDRYFYTNQYKNESNPGAHARTTAQEIIADVGPRLTHFVAGIGTSGTVMGTGRALKAYRPEVEIVAVEPSDEFHGLEGLKHIKTSIVPPIYDATVMDRTIFLDTDVGWNVTDRLLADEGLAVGHSAGAAAAVASQLAKDASAAGKPACVVCIFPDHAARYVEAKRNK
jgi:S-sulfo-L-cysteine synthase (O-acetyl-L-serine-dependent)